MEGSQRPEQRLCPPGRQGREVFPCSSPGLCLQGCWRRSAALCTRGASPRGQKRDGPWVAVGSLPAGPAALPSRSAELAAGEHTINSSHGSFKQALRVVNDLPLFNVTNPHSLWDSKLRNYGEKNPQRKHLPCNKARLGCKSPQAAGTAPSRSEAPLQPADKCAPCAGCREPRAEPSPTPLHPLPGGSPVPWGAQPRATGTLPAARGGALGAEPGRAGAAAAPRVQGVRRCCRESIARFPRH